MPTFKDYHRTVIGFHGTRKTIAESIVLGKTQFAPSQNSGDWLGNGVYFWEYAPQQAWAWAKARYPDEEVAVLGAMIRLGSCFDLLDPTNVAALESFHSQMVADCEQNNIEPPPQNWRSNKHTDCAVFEYAYGASLASDNKIDTCRAVFVPSVGSKRARPWKSSGIFRDAHIQLCVRNVSCIQGIWLMTPEEEDQ